MPRFLFGPGLYLLFSGTNNLHVFSLGLLRNLLPSSVTVNTSDPLQGLAYNVLVSSLLESCLLPL